MLPTVPQVSSVKTGTAAGQDFEDGFDTVPRINMGICCSSLADTIHDSLIGVLESYIVIMYETALSY